MDEDEFWRQLERRVTVEFAGLVDAKLRHLWCDGFIPEEFKVKPGGVGVLGGVWIGVNGRRQEKWGFTLLVSRSLVVREEVNWAGLIPPENMTGWMSAYVAQKFLKMNPFAARLDSEA